VAAEGLRADDGADHVAVDVDVAGGEARDDALDRLLDARMDAERQARSRWRRWLEHTTLRARPPSSARHAGPGRTPRGSAPAASSAIDVRRRRRCRPQAPAGTPALEATAAARRIAAIMGVEPLPSPRASITGPTWVAGSAGSPSLSSRRRRSIISIIGRRRPPAREQAQRRAALAGRAEGRGHDVVGDLLGQRGGVDDHGVDAAGLGDQRHDRAVLGRERPVDGARDLGRAGEGDAGDRGGDQRRADAPSPGRAAAPRRARRPRAAAAPRRGGDQRRLLGGLGDDALPAASAAATWPRKIASGKFHGEMQTKVPRPRRMQHGSPRRSGRASLATANFASRLGGVVAAEVDRLADLGDGVVERLAGLALRAARERPRSASSRSAALAQRGGAARGPACVPGRGSRPAAASMAAAGLRHRPR
jgi:hypothetical protein